MRKAEGPPGCQKYVQILLNKFLFRSVFDYAVTCYLIYSKKTGRTFESTHLGEAI